MKSLIILLGALLSVAHAQKADIQGFEFKAGSFMDTMLEYRCNGTQLTRKQYIFGGLKAEAWERLDSVVLTKRDIRSFKRYLNRHKKEFEEEGIQCRALSMVQASVAWVHNGKPFGEGYYPCGEKLLPSRFLALKAFLERFFR